MALVGVGLPGCSLLVSACGDRGSVALRGRALYFAGPLLGRATVIAGPAGRRARGDEALLAGEGPQCFDSPTSTFSR
jgi:hypothetical protein